MGAHHDWNSPPGSRGCKPSALPLSNHSSALPLSYPSSALPLSYPSVCGHHSIENPFLIYGTRRAVDNPVIVLIVLKL